MITNYCRRKNEYAFYANGEQPAPRHVAWDWVWWRAPVGHENVKLVGESYDTLAAVAQAFRCEEREVLSLIERGRLRAIRSQGVVLIVHSSLVAMREGREAA